MRHIKGVFQRRVERARDLDATADFGIATGRCRQPKRPGGGFFVRCRVDPHVAVLVARRKARHRAHVLFRIADEAGNTDAHAGAVVAPAMIGALKLTLESVAEGQRRVAMRAAVEERGRLVVEGRETGPAEC
jgi:hypothetical protein